MLEIIAVNIEDISAINESSASRIELIRDGNTGGLTPTIQVMDQARHLTEKPIFVMIRPNHTSFIYTKAEKREMIESIKIAKLTGLDGIVIGALTPYGEIDLNFMREVVEVARPLEITFHRAFEEVNDLKKSALEVASLGINFILTSGKKKNPLDAIDTLKELAEALKSTNTEILIGGGVNQGNIHTLRELTGLNNFHAGSAVRENTNYQGSILASEINKMI